MEEFMINEMKEMQRKLQEKYKEQWEGISPEVGKNKLLWMIGEVGEVIDIVKKQGDRNACQNEAVRKELIASAPVRKSPRNGCTIWECRRIRFMTWPSIPPAASPA